MRRGWLLYLVIGLVSGFASPALGAPGGDAGRGSGTTASVPVSQLMQEIQVLQTLRGLELTPAQTEKLLALARTADEAGRDPRDCPEGRRVIGELRQALLEGKDFDVLGPLYEKLEQISRPGGAGDEPEARLQKARLQAARRAVEIFTPDQLLQLMGGDGGEGGVEAELIAAARRIRDQPAAKQTEAINEVATRLAPTATRDADRVSATRQEIESFLKDAAKLSATAFDAEMSTFQARAAKIAQDAAGSNLAALQIRAERRLLDLLSQPVLVSVLEEKLKRSAPSSMPAK
jgi:hypothetical protein